MTATHAKPSPSLSPGAPQQSSSAAKPAASMMRKGSVGKQPLVPPSEARCYDLQSSASRRRRETESEKWDPNLDNASAARDGRQFAVSNVGNNGRIYLRPSVRRNNQKSQNQQSFNLPTTPPQSFDYPPVSQQDRITIKATNAPPVQWPSIPHDSMASLTDSPAASRRANHRHALSDGTAHEVAVPRTAEAAAYTAPKTSVDECRPRTMDHPATTLPLLNINIPSWRLGTPRFTVRGTALIRGSSYAPTEDLPSSSSSILNPLPGNAQPTSDFDWNKPAAVFISPQHVVAHAAPRSPGRPPSPLRLRAMRSAHLSTHLFIEPDMFTALTFRPACDDRTIVRYAPTTGSVAAATPPRLVAEITSPTFLDYELISDFFLTYRSFLESPDLLRMLFARMRWALARRDEIGMIVRVRTFVATRHWILNYFTDDFLLNYDLRKEFCHLLNGVVDDLSGDVQTRNVQLRVIAELKKCWRRVCAHYWDSPSFDDSLSVEATVVPGGIAGHRDPTLNPSYWQTVGQQPHHSPSLPRTHGADVGFSTGLNSTPKIGDFIVFGDRPLTPEHIAMDLARSQEAGTPHSMGSMGSVDVVSCMVPNRALKGVTSRPNQQWIAHPHPVPATAQVNRSGAVAVPPRALAGKRARHAHSHKRSNSVSDSLRGHLTDRLPNNVEFPTILPSAGSLVRGNVLPPGQAFVDTSAQDCGAMAHRQTTIFTPPARRVFKDRAFNGAMSGSGMKRLLASVKRALSARGIVTAPTQANLTRISPVGPSSAASSRLPGTAVVPQEEAQHNGGRPAVRIDLLGAEVAEDFKKAVREEQAQAPTPPEPSSAPPPRESIAQFCFGDLPSIDHQRPTSDMGITTGSKSIVIVDDTVPFEFPQSIMLRQPRVRSVEALTDSFMPATGDPTPPNTPPAKFDRGTPRGSSYLLQPSIHHPDVLPPFIPDLATLQQNTSSRTSDGLPGPQSSRYPPLSGGTFRMHRRTRSSKTQQSLNSVLHRRHSSFSSSVMHPSTIRGFDITALSDTSIDAEIAVPEPLRVLRRRPGGDLRIATRVVDLEQKVLRRSQSMGSTFTFSESVRSASFFGPSPVANADAESDYGDYHQERQEVFSLGQLTEQQPNKAAKLSLFSTHSSKPAMRPSFEAEAQRLAQIPDDEDDGGIESALLKLEGKFSRKSKDESLTTVEAGEEIDMEKLGQALQFLGGAPSESSISRSQRLLTEKSNTLSIDLVTTDDLSVPEGSRSEITMTRSFLSESSVESYNSIPLLDRELSQHGGGRRVTDTWAEKSVLRDSGDVTPVEGYEFPTTFMHSDADYLETNPPAASWDQDYDLVEKTNSMERIMPGDTQPSFQHHQSFLEDASYANSDISSELSTEVTPLQTTDNLIRSRRKLPPHPLGDVIADSMLHPISPPLSTPRQQASPTFNSAHAMHASRPLPPTPDATPTAPYTQTLAANHLSPATMEMPRAAPQPDPGVKKFSVHLPFILAFDSDVLAQQFTLIEKDALNEIDWKELIEMNWKNATSSGSRSWVDFLRNSDAHGVEVVIARFNIMVKWAVSEIVLTQHVEERARCIIKMIHIAAHCRRYRNFATLAQLTIALSSNEVARLSKTWTMVPAHDLRTLAELEALVTPTRNFLNLRAEMEVGTDTGCIPFVGIYTHDLLYNAQRPSEIPGTAEAPPLVNFERCRIAAAVVKVLLRLLESSTRYAFQPIEGITERCLWVGALSDEEIRSHSDALEC